MASEQLILRQRLELPGTPRPPESKKFGLPNIRKHKGLK